MSRRRVIIRGHAFLPDGEYTYARYVVANRIGRKLLRTEIVHHIDDDHTNDADDNLELVTPKRHAEIHLKGKKRSDIARRRIGDSQRGIPKSAATKERMRKAALRAWKRRKSVDSLAESD